MEKKEISHSFEKLTKVDQYLTTVLFNERKKDFPHTFVHKLFEQCVKKYSSKPALIFEDTSLTYEELNTEANKLAHYLISKGIQKEDFVCISLNRSKEMVIASIAVLKAGAAYIPIEPSFPEDLIKFLITDANPKFIITSQNVVSKFADLNPEKVVLDTDKNKIEKCSLENPDVKLSKNNLAYAIYTSGSTGQRKAALIEHKGLTNQRYAWIEALGFNDKDVYLQSATFSMDVFTADWVKALTTGATLVVNPKNMVFDMDNDQNGEYLYQMFLKYGITCIDLTPPVLRKLIAYAKKNKKPLDMLRLIVVGCDSWYTSEHKDLVSFTKGQVRVADSYGMTEGTVDTTYFEDYSQNHEDSVSLVGKIYYNNEVYILDDDNYVVPVGDVGELCISGIPLSRGYHNREQLTKERFVMLTFPDGSKKRIYKSGDLARYRKDGTLEFLGRKDNQIEIGGIRIELGEIEKTIQKNEAVYENVVLFLDGKDKKKKLVCYLVLNKGMQLTAEQLKEFLSSKLPVFMIPPTINFLPNIPLTPAGKLDRKKLATLTDSII